MSRSHLLTHCYQACTRSFQTVTKLLHRILRSPPPMLTQPSAGRWRFTSPARCSGCGFGEAKSHPAPPLWRPCYGGSTPRYSLSKACVCFQTIYLRCCIKWQQLAHKTSECRGHQQRYLTPSINLDVMVALNKVYQMNVCPQVATRPLVPEGGICHSATLESGKTLLAREPFSPPALPPTDSAVVQRHPCDRGSAGRPVSAHELLLRRCTRTLPDNAGRGWCTTS